MSWFFAPLTEKSLSAERPHCQLMAVAASRRAWEARWPDAGAARRVLPALVHEGGRRGDARAVRHAPVPDDLAGLGVERVELRTRRQERRGTLLGLALVGQAGLHVGSALEPGEDEAPGGGQGAAVAGAQAVGLPGELPFQRVVRQVD